MRARLRPRRPARDPRPAGLPGRADRPRHAGAGAPAAARARSSAPATSARSSTSSAAPVDGPRQGDPLQRPAQGRQPDRHRPHPHDLCRPPSTYAVVIPIERRSTAPTATAPPSTSPNSPAAASSPTSTAGSAAATASTGSERSYVSARCTDGIIRTHGHFLFADGTIMDGTLEKPCTPGPALSRRPRLGRRFLYFPAPGR